MTHPADRNYPLPRPAEDERFTWGLTLDVAARIEAQGYPVLTSVDVVTLQSALFDFLYAAPTTEENPA